MKPLFTEDYCGCETQGECPYLAFYTEENGNEIFECMNFQEKLSVDEYGTRRKTTFELETLRCDECKERYSEQEALAADCKALRNNIDLLEAKQKTVIAELVKLQNMINTHEEQLIITQDKLLKLKG